MGSEDFDPATRKVILGLAIFFAALIGLVVTVALLQRRLDPTAVVTLLGGIFSGILSGILLRRKGGDGG